MAEAQAIFGYLIGLDHPEAASAAEARTWITECGAHRLLELWADGLPPADAEDRRAR